LEPDSKYLIPSFSLHIYPKLENFESHINI
jgi:hypothetical protein